MGLLTLLIKRRLHVQHLINYVLGRVGGKHKWSKCTWTVCSWLHLKKLLQHKEAFLLCIYVVGLLGSEIPEVVVSDISILRHDDDVTLICNLTERGDQASTPVKRISWLKDGVVLKSVRIRSPNPRDPTDMLGRLNLKDVGARDGGEYACLLQVLLRNIREFNITASTVIHSKKKHILL